MSDANAASPLGILLADEQAAACDLARRVLGRLHHRVATVASGRSALARAQRDRVDLAIVSTTLPDMPGAALIGALRSLPALERAPIVAICDDDAAVREACLAAGATACLERPLGRAPLLGLLEPLVRGRGETGEPVLDWDHLRRFTDGDPQLESELGALYLSTSGVYLQEMRQALQEGRAWTSTAHALKGASANLGARRVARLALAAERSEPDPAQLEALAAAIEEIRAVLEPGRPASGQGLEHGENAPAARESP
jgi:CheY-like chemotaxis protein